MVLLCKEFAEKEGIELADEMLDAVAGGRMVRVLL